MKDNKLDKVLKENIDYRLQDAIVDSHHSLVDTFLYSLGGMAEEIDYSDDVLELGINKKSLQAFIIERSIKRLHDLIDSKKFIQDVAKESAMWVDDIDDAIKMIRKDKKNLEKDKEESKKLAEKRKKFASSLSDEQRKSFEEIMNEV